MRTGHSDSEEDDAERLAWEKDDDDSDVDDDVAAAAAEVEEEQGKEGDPHAPRASTELRSKASWVSCLCNFLSFEVAS
jgi:hypothetical protein